MIGSSMHSAFTADVLRSVARTIGERARMAASLAAVFEARLSRLAGTRAHRRLVGHSFIERHRRAGACVDNACRSRRGLSFAHAGARSGAALGFELVDRPALADLSSAYVGEAAN